jgi:hypothetical protein
LTPNLCRRQDPCERIIYTSRNSISTMASILRGVQRNLASAFNDVETSIRRATSRFKTNVNNAMERMHSKMSTETLETVIDEEDMTANDDKINEKRQPRHYVKVWCLHMHMEICELVFSCCHTFFKKFASILAYI